MRLSSFFLSLSLGLLTWSTSAAPVPAREDNPAQADRDFLCPPRLQLRHPQRCPSYGPGGALLALAHKGLYPPKPLPVVAIDPELSDLPYSYVKADSGPTDVYSSAEGAANHSGDAITIAGGFVYLSTFGRFESSGTTVYGTRQGYVRGSDVSRVKPPASPGIAFSRTPDRPVAWIIAGGTCTSRTAGGLADPDGRCFTRNTVVQIYGVQHVDGWDWYMIGQDEWIEQKLLAVVDPDPTPPEGIEGDRWISVNLYEQTVAAYEDGELRFATVASTGQHGAWTQPGVFQVWAKLERDDMTGGVTTAEGSGFYYLEDVPWVLYFDQSRALHGTYWHGRFGTPSSRGCVNLAPTDANWIYNFAEEGTWVYVWDPSGNTPTDPSVYGPGGA